MATRGKNRTATYERFSNSSQKNDYSYGWEKLHGAIYSLAGPGDQRERLANAIDHLHNIEIIRNPKYHLPKDIRDEYLEFVENMSSAEPTGNEGIIRATVNTLSDKEIQRAVATIISFHYIICSQRNWG